MMRGMFAAISGLRNHQTMLDVTANDIANVNTVGYKSARATFADALSQTQRGAASPGTTGGTNPAQVGLGVRLGSIDNLMSGGTMQSTGNGLDVAIQGEGYFRVGLSTPPAAPTTFGYTRAGNFSTNEDGRLVTSEGYYVTGRTTTDATGVDTLLTIPPGSSSVAIGGDGSVSYSPAGGGARAIAGYISLAKFPNEAGLERSSGTRWGQSANSGAPAIGVPGGDFGVTTAGVLEMSNVDLAQSFTQMITAQRGFQANSRVISTADQMLQDLVNLNR